MLLLGAVFLVGLMLYASVAKMVIMMAVQEKPEAFQSKLYRLSLSQQPGFIVCSHPYWCGFSPYGGLSVAALLSKKLSTYSPSDWPLVSHYQSIGLCQCHCDGCLCSFRKLDEVVTTLVFGSYLLICTWWAYHFARQRKIALHKEWVYRVYFVALAIATIRIVAGIGMTITGNSLKNMLGISFAIAFILHTVIVESWIRWSRK
jgi:hypothetical protein